MPFARTADHYKEVSETAGAFGLIFGLGVHHVYISGAIEAIFEFPPTS